MRFREERMTSYVVRGNKLIADGKKLESMKLIEKGLQYYIDRIIKAITPYAKDDAGLIVLVLERLADEVAKANPGAREMAEGLGKCFTSSPLKEEIMHKKPNRR